MYSPVRPTSSLFCKESATSYIYTLSLHDALPISPESDIEFVEIMGKDGELAIDNERLKGRSEEHTSELQSRGHLVCRLLLEKKNKRMYKFVLHELPRQTRGQAVLNGSHVPARRRV